MTAAASRYAVRSAHDETRYPPPSCSAFHGRRGSSECAVITCGTPVSSPPTCPARLAYQVCECSDVLRAEAATISRSTARVCSAGFAPRTRRVPGWALASGRGSPKQCT